MALFMYTSNGDRITTVFTIHKHEMGFGDTVKDLQFWDNLVRSYNCRTNVFAAKSVTQVKNR